MAGTREGGKLAAQTNKKKYGKDYYKRIGSVGGKLGHTGGFYYSAANGYDWHIKAGAKGGKISKRGTKTVNTTKVYIQKFTGKGYEYITQEAQPKKKHWWSK